MWVEYEGARPIFPGALERPLDRFVVLDFEPTQRNGRACDVADQRLEAIPVCSFDSRCGVQGEPIGLVDELGSSRRRSPRAIAARGRVDQSRNRLTAVLAQGDLGLDRSGLDEGEARLARVRVVGWRRVFKETKREQHSGDTARDVPMHALDFDRLEWRGGNELGVAVNSRGDM